MHLSTRVSSSSPDSIHPPASPSAQAPFNHRLTSRLIGVSHRSLSESCLESRVDASLQENRSLSEPGLESRLTLNETSLQSHNFTRIQRGIM